MPLLLTMTLCGSVGTLIYFILSPLTTRFFSLQWRRIYLICCILCYLIPFPCILTQYKTWIYKILTRFLSQETVGKPTFLNITGVAVQLTEKGLYIHNGLIYLFFIGMFFMGVALFGKEFYKQIQVSRYFKKNKNISVSEKNWETIQKYISDNHIKNVRICECNWSSEVFSPFTLGVINPVIILPSVTWKDQDLLEMVLKHETVHIEQKDFAIRMLALAAVVLHFYNPLSYYLLAKWTDITEMCCDQKVLAGRTGDDVTRYGMMIVDLSHGKIGSQMTPLVGFSLKYEEKALTERVMEMKKEVKKEKLFKKVLGASTLSAALFLSSLSVLAYSPKQIIHTERATDEIVLTDSCVDAWETGNIEIPVNDDEWVLVDPNGEVEIVSKNDEGIEPQLFCNHDYVECQGNGHTMTEGGGCIVDIYEAKRCTKCGAFKFGNLISTHTYVKCPHK